MTQQEKRLLWVAVAIFAGYAVPFRLVPAVTEGYKDYQAQQKHQSLEIQRLQRLSQQKPKWEEEFKQAQAQQTQIEKTLLQGDNQELVSAYMKNLLRTLAVTAQVNQKSLELSEFTTTDTWLMVTQAMQFEASSQQTMALLKSIKEQAVMLSIVSLDVRVIRKDRIQGTIKVTGFSQAVQPSTDEDGEDVATEDS